MNRLERLRPAVAAALLAGATLLAHASPERDRIVAERQAAVARFAEQERACAERFIVTSCVDAARKEQRATLTRLRRAEQALDDVERREAAQRRLAELDRQAAARDARASEPAPTEHRANEHTRPVANPPASPHPQAPASSTAERRAIEQRNEADFADRERAAQAHREAIAKRNARRASEGKVAAPLPLPSSASAP
jgi:colicin import membrane protein